jgi:DNA primase
MVEGYADLISLYQAGIQNVVASSGTALTEEQVQLISRYSKKLTLVYDADSAGSNATIRGMDIALAQDLDVMIVELPEGEDPDSFVKKSGGKEFRKLLEQGVSFIDFKAKQFLKAGAFATPEGKAQAVRSIVQSIAKMKDELKRNFYIKEVATKYDIYESVLYRELDRWTGEKNRPAYPRPDSAQRSQPVPETSKNGTVPAGKKEAPVAERDILKLLLEHHADMIGFIFSYITVDDISDPQLKKIVEFLLARFDEKGPGTVTEFVNEIVDPVLKSLVTDIVMSKYEISKRWESSEMVFEEVDPWRVARDAIVAMVKRKLHALIEINRRALKDASARGADVQALMQRNQELTIQLGNVDSGMLFKSN